MRINWELAFEFVTRNSVDSLIKNLCDNGIKLGNYHYRVNETREKIKTKILLTPNANVSLYYNSFIPDIEIEGSLQNKDSICIKLKMSKRVKPVFIFTMCLCIVFQLSLVLLCLFEFASFSLPMLIPLFIFIFGYAVMTIGFLLSAKYIKEELLDELALQECNR